MMGYKCIFKWLTWLPGRANLAAFLFHHREFEPLFSRSPAKIDSRLGIEVKSKKNFYELTDSHKQKHRALNLP